MIYLAAGSEWLQFSEDAVARVPAFPTLEHPALVLWSPERGVSGVTALEGNARHAAVLIDRRLRAEGATEGETKVFVHHVRPVGQGYQAIYTAAPLEEWQRLLAWSGAQREHCLLALPASVMWACRQDHLGAVFHRGVHLELLGMVDDRIFHLSSMAFSDSDEDLAMAARALGERAMAEVSRSGAKRESAQPAVQWFSALALGGSAVRVEPTTGPHLLQQAFASASGLRVESRDERFDDRDAAQAAFSGVCQLAGETTTSLALNTAGDKWLWTAERFLSACAFASWAVAIALLAVSGHWVLQSRQALQLMEGLQAQEMLSRRHAADVESKVQAPGGLESQLALVEALQKLASGHDASGLLNALKTATSADMNILGVRAEPSTAAPATAVAPVSFVVDGSLTAGPVAQDSQSLSAFVRGMRNQGYDAEPLDAKVPAAGTSGSSRLFSYRLVRRPDESAGRS